jgi:L-iditol 2-dehydrogenase
MKALLHTRPYEFEYTEYPDPDIGPDDVLVRVEAVGICGSDVHGYTGETGRRIPPVIMGHEAAGTVEAVGSRVSGIAAGDRVCFDSTVYCNACAACRAGAFNRCERRQVLGVSVPDMPRRHGCMAEFVTVPEWTVHSMPEGLSFREAALLEPVSIALHAARRGQISNDDVALVIGCGTIGLFLIQAVRLEGARRVIASDPDKSRLDLARRLGADVTVNPRADDLITIVKDETDGAGVDVSFEAVGFSATLLEAIAAARTGGRIVLVGNLTPKIELDVPHIISQELSLIGTYASGGEYRDAIGLVTSGKLDVGTLISDVVPLSEGQRAFDRLYRGESGLVKIILEPNGA